VKLGSRVRSSGMRLLLLPLLLAFVFGGWQDPSVDTQPNPACNPSAVTPRIRKPANVSELHPGHLRYAMAIGDSITAAALAKGLPLEYRQVSWSAGSEEFSMPFYVKQYSNSLVGASQGEFQFDQLGPCCGKPPWWSGIHGNNDQLNVALSGACASDWRLEVDHLTDLVTGKGFGIEHLGGFPKWTHEQQQDYKNNWKVLTVFFGMNDLLTSDDACNEDENVRNAVVANYKNNMVALLDYLVADKDGVFGNIYINLMTLFTTSYMAVENYQAGWCKISGNTFLKSEAACYRSGGDLKLKGARVDNVTKHMNDVLKELAESYDGKRPDFGINLVQTLANQQITHEDLRSSLDCFHPTEKAHRKLGVALWNAMLQTSHPTPIDNLPTMPACVNADTRLVTYKMASPTITSTANSTMPTLTIGAKPNSTTLAKSNAGINVTAQPLMSDIVV